MTWEERAIEIADDLRKHRLAITPIAVHDRLQKEGYKTTVIQVAGLELKHKRGRHKKLLEAGSAITNGIPIKSTSTVKTKPTPPEITEEDIITELIKERKIQIVEDYKLKLLKEEIKRQAATEILIEKMVSAIQVLQPIKIEKIEVDSQTTSREQRAVLMLSDVQAGTYINKESTGGLNEYNQFIRKLQFKQLRDGVISITHKMRHTSPINTLHLHMLGDMVEGLDIFVGQTQHVDQDLYDQCFDLANDICKLIIELLNMFDHIIVKGVVGNHGRVGKKGENPHWVNWDLIVYKFIESTLANYKDRISFDFPKSWWLIEKIFDHKFLLTHGDGIKAWMGVPFYGIQRADSRWTMMLQSIHEEYNYLEIGHFHTPSFLPRVIGETIINGCWPGGSIFALKDLLTTIRPSQAFFGVHPEKGVSFRYPIWLDVPRT